MDNLDFVNLSFEEQKEYLARYTGKGRYSECPLSAFMKIAKMNTAFGFSKGAMYGDWDALASYIDNIADELDELREAISAGDHEQVRDALGDIIVFTYGGFFHIGENGDKDLDSIYESNMSKFIKNDEELAATIKKYADLGVEVVPEGVYPQVKVTATTTQTGNDGKLYRGGKFLKGVGFFEPRFV
jgi:NTP pyrophosphatase (non-canonical NTP hydrolase)